MFILSHRNDICAKVQFAGIELTRPLE